jgi:hypothetical protein
VLRTRHLASCRCSLAGVARISRFPIDDTIRNLFKRSARDTASVLPECSCGYSLDLDSIVFERYGHQQGALRGPNPRKHGRPSHHPLVAVLAEAHFLLHGWLRSGNCGTARGVVEFLKEALAMLPEKHSLRVLRADAGFFGQQLLGFLEQRGLSYIVVARLTRWLKREAARVTEWRALDEHYSGGVFLAASGLGPSAPLRGHPRATAHGACLTGKKTTRGTRLHLPRLRQQPRSAPEEIWREYNGRADMKNRIAERKHDLAADDFCLHEFFATEAAFRSILLLFNLLGEFQRTCRFSNSVADSFVCRRLTSVGPAGCRGKTWKGLSPPQPTVVT